MRSSDKRHKFNVESAMKFFTGLQVSPCAVQAWPHMGLLIISLKTHLINQSVYFSSENMCVKKLNVLLDIEQFTSMQTQVRFNPISDFARYQNAIFVF